MRHINLKDTLKQQQLRFWLTWSGWVGIGLLPCPECGSPMIVHFWPLALLYSLRHFLHRHREKSALMVVQENHNQEGLCDP